MSYLMDYGPDWPPQPEPAEPAPGFPPMPLWKRCVAYAIIPAIGLWLVGEACLYVRAHTELTRPASHGVEAPQSPHVAK